MPSIKDIAIMFINLHYELEGRPNSPEKKAELQEMDFVDLGEIIHDIKDDFVGTPIVLTGECTYFSHDEAEDVCNMPLRDFILTYMMMKDNWGDQGEWKALHHLVVGCRLGQRCPTCGHVQGRRGKSRRQKKRDDKEEKAVGK